MVRILRNIFFLAAGVVIALAALELTLRMLPVIRGENRTDDYQRWPVVDLEAHQRYSFSTGWALQNAHRGTTNNYGAPAPFDFVPDSHPLIVVGDSYIESLMNDYGDTLQAQLDLKLGGRHEVYGLGTRGLSISDYIGLARVAHKEFKPRAAVFVLTDGDFSESIGAKVGNYFFVEKHDQLDLQYVPIQTQSGQRQIRSVIGEISVFRYFQQNLQFSLNAVVDGLFGRKKKVEAAATPVVSAATERKVADFMLASLPTDLGIEPRCIVFLLDSDRVGIYEPRSKSVAKDSNDVRDYFIASARQQGFRVGDLEPEFRRQYSLNHQRFDYWPLDRHWNRLGHGVAADEALRLLHGTESSPGCL